MAQSEFEIIARYFSDIGISNTGTNGSNAPAPGDLGVGDDCALLTIPAGEKLAVSIDTLVAGVHFPTEASAYDIATRSLSVAISDLAAMGAAPLAFTLALTLPSINEFWLKGFSDGLRACATDYGLPLIGGDTTRGPLTISIQVHGAVPARRALTRSGASVGDRIFATGALGDGAAALAVLQQRLEVNAEQAEYFSARFYRPQARISTGLALRGVASAAIDISDGLLADLGHILEASGVGAEINTAQLPISQALAAAASAEQYLEYALAGGDDYELCFTVAPEHVSKLQLIAQQAGVSITDIGRIVDNKELRCFDEKGRPIQSSHTGYQHFT